MPKLFSRLRVRLMLLVLLAVLPTLGLILYTNLHQRRLAATAAQSEALRLTRLAGVEQAQLIDRAHQLLVALAQLPAVRSGAPTECRLLFSRLLDQFPFYTGFALTRPNGDLFCSVPAASKPVNFADRAWYRRLIDNHDFVVGPYQIGRLSGQAIVVLALPVLDGTGQLQRIVTTGLDLTWLERLLAQAQLPPDSSVLVIDRNGTILARYPDDGAWLGQTMPDGPLIDTMRAQGEGTLEAPGVDGLTRLYAFAPLSSVTEEEQGLSVSIGIPSRIVLAEANRILWINLAWLGLVAAVALAAAWIGSELFFLRPVNTLLDATRHLAAGDLKRRTQLSYDQGELGQLAQAMDQMAAALARHNRERQQAEAAVRHLNAELEQRVQQRTAALEAANRELEAFSYSVSHDLRAPLRAMDGFSRILLEGYAAQLTPEAGRYLQMVQDNAGQMGRLIDDLLAFSRLSRQPLNTVAVSPADLVGQVLEALQGGRTKRQVEITVDDLPACRADPLLLRQVFANLLDNAFKYTQNRAVARIEVGCQNGADSPGEPVYFVRDNGVGFDMRYVDKLFGVFQRLHRAEEFEGTGVGLATVQRIIHRHGGRIWAEAAEEQGATFYFTLGQGGGHD